MEQLKPYAHQLEALRRISDVYQSGGKGFALFMEQGTGKTKVVIDWGIYLFQQEIITGLLVIAAPNGVHSNWHEVELPKHCSIPYYSAAWSAPSGLSKKRKAELEECFTPDPTQLKILCMNIEALSHQAAVDEAVRFLEAHKAMIADDESSWIKNETAKRTKNCIKKLAPRALFRIIMTGTPYTNAPLDCYTQFEFLDPSIINMKSFNVFRARYADMLPVTHPLMIATIAKNMGISREKCMGLAKLNRIPKHRTPPMVKGYKKLDELKAKLDPVSYRVLKQDCLDLPPKVYQLHFVELGKEQAKMYKELEDKLRIEFAESEITATMALTKLLRLQQIAGGFVGLDDLEFGERKVVPIPDNKRIAALLDLLEVYDGKVIIWARFRAEIEAIHKAIVEKYGRGSAGMYYGDTRLEDRNELVNSFQGKRPIMDGRKRVGWEDIPPEEQVQYFIGNPHSAGYGITLTAASTVIYYSNDFSLETRLQSEDRAHRIGQENKVTYIDMQAKGTIDSKIIEALRNKKGLANTMTGDRTTWI